MPHSNEDKLIQYQFGLLDEAEKAAIAAHLAECTTCRRKLDELKQKFTSLDLLADEITPSDVLISQTMIHAAKPVSKALFSPWKRFGWLAAAAGFLIAATFMVSNPGRQEDQSALTTTREISKLPQAEQPPKDFSRTFGEDLDSNGKAELKMELTADAPAEIAATAKLSPTNVASPGHQSARIVDAEQIPDKAPFAPASAIELVVLPQPDKMQLTIYNSADLTLVRDTRKLTLKPGWNWLQFMWANTKIDPTSLSLRPLAHADKVEIEQLIFPAGLREIGRWLIRSEVEGAVPFEITYFTSGLSWRAFYMGTMNPDEAHMDLKGYVRVDNQSGQDYENAQTRLIVGEVHLLDQIRTLADRYYPYGPDVMMDDTNLNVRGRDGRILMYGDMPQMGALFKDYDGDGMMGGMGGRMSGYGFYDRIKEIEKEGLSEYFLYTIEGTETIPHQWAKRLPSMDIEQIRIESLYKYDEDRYGTDTVRFVSFANDTEHELGATPLPDGTVKIFRKLNDQQNLSYIGGTDVKYIPVNEDVELNLGPAQLVKVEPILMDIKTDNYTFNPKGQISGWDEIETWKIKLTNPRRIGIELEITRNFAVDQWDIEFSSQQPIDYEKLDIRRARFTATLPPHTEQEFMYTVTKYLKERADIKAKENQEP